MYSILVIIHNWAEIIQNYSMIDSLMIRELDKTKTMTIMDSGPGLKLIYLTVSVFLYFIFILDKAIHS